METIDKILFTVLVGVVIFVSIFAWDCQTIVVGEEFKEGIVTDVDYATGAGTIIQIGNSERFTLTARFNTEILIGHKYRFYEMRTSLFKVWKGYHFEEVDGEHSSFD